MEVDRVENLWAKTPSQATYFLSIFLYCHIILFFFSFPSHSRILGMFFFSFPSLSRIEGMGFLNSLPVPEFREWNYPFPFPFPNAQKSFPLTPVVSLLRLSRIKHSQVIPIENLSPSFFVLIIFLEARC